MTKPAEDTRRPPLAAVLCGKADALLDRTMRVMRLLHEGAWLGVLTAEERDAVTTSFYSASNMFASREHNVNALFDWEREAVGRYFGPGSSVLVPAAGAGREVLQLRRMGFRAQGFDCCPRLVEASKQLFQAEDAGPPVILSAPNEVPPGLPRFDGVLVGWGGYHHIQGRERRIRFLGQLRRLIEAGGPLVVSFFHRHDSDVTDRWLPRVAGVFRVLSFFRGEPVEPGDRLSARSLRHCFTEAEIRDELKAGGFRLDCYSEEEYGHAVGIAE